METPRRARLRPGLAVALVIALAASSSLARPFTINDFLGRADVGSVSVAGQRLIVEKRGPTTSAARYDLDALQDLERTTLWVTDPTHPGPPQPLFRANQRAGYSLGPVSPDGRQIAVMRLTARNWELGVADPARRRVRWLGITPEMTSGATTVAWRSTTTLIVVARQPGALPRNLGYRRVMPTEAPKLWQSTAQGGLSVRVFDSGPGATRQLDQRRLVEVDLGSGRRRELAQGPIMGLALSPNHRRAALIVEGRDHPLSATHSVQGAFGFEATERHLLVIDLDNGVSRKAAAAWDILLHPLAWSDDDRELVAYGRDRDTPWSEGHFLRVDGESGAAEPVLGLHASLDSRPEAARAGWVDGQLLAWGALRSEEAPQWWRVSAEGPQALAETLGIGRTGLTRTPDGLVGAGRDGIWRIPTAGPPTLLAAGAHPIAYPQLNREYAFEYEIPRAASVIARRTTGALAVVHADHVEGLPPIPGDAEVLHPSEVTAGLVLRRSRGGGVLDLDWAPRNGPALTLFHLNSGLAALDPPDIRAVHHLGPEGQTLTSWLLLPRLPVGAPPPPLIVIPYPGARYPAEPAAMDSWTGGPDKSAALLAAHGYAVLAPSLPIADGAEPATNLAQRVLAIIDQAKAEPALRGTFDPERLGVWGDSFGGWGTLMMITQTNRFKAAIAEASMSDLVSEWGQFESFVRLDPTLGPSPFFTEGWVEDLQGGMHGPPWAAPERYLRNSAVFHADQVTTPLLLIHGDQDAFSMGQAEEMFSALNRQNKTAELVVYWGEGHAIASPGSLRDLYTRVFRWFDDRLMAPSAPERPPANPGSASASSAQTTPPRSRTTAVGSGFAG